MISQYRDHLGSFTRNARLFLLAMTILAFGTAAPTLFFNVYLEKTGFDRAFIGGVNSVIQLGGIVMALPAAVLLNRIGRKRAISLALAIGLVSWSLSLFTQRGALILALQMINGAGTVLFGLAVVPLLAESSSPRERTTLFSVSEGVTTLALFFGSVLFGFVPGWLAALIHSETGSATTYRAALLLSAILRGIGLIPFLFLRQSKPTTDPSPAPKTQNGPRHYHPRKLLKLKTPIWLLCVPYLLVYCGGSLVFPFLALFLKERFAASDSAIGLVLFNLTLPIYKAYVVDHAPPEEYTLVSLILSTSANVGPAIAPPFSGWLQREAGFAPVFALAIGFYVLGGLAFRFVFGRRLPTM